MRVFGNDKTRVILEHFLLGGQEELFGLLQEQTIALGHAQDVALDVYDAGYAIGG